MKPAHKAVLASVLVVALVLGWCLPSEQDGFIVGLYPAEGLGAVALMRHNDDTSRVWAVGLDVNAGPQWRTLLGPETFSIMDRQGMSVADGIVTVRVTDDSTWVETVALDLRDGREIWRTERLTYEPDPELPVALSINTPGVTARADGGQLFEFHRERDQILVVAHDRSSGEVLWKADVVAGMVREVVPMESVLVLRTDADWLLLDRDRGEERGRIEIRGDACIHDGRIVHYRHPQVVAFDPRESTERVLTPDLAWPGREDDSHHYARSCGIWRGSIVFSLSNDISGTHLVALDPESGESSWSIDLGFREFNIIGQGRSGWGMQGHPLRGELADFVAFVADDKSSRGSGDDGHALLVVDLLGRRIGWESPPRSELLHYSVFSAEGRYYLYYSGHVAVIDGRTGTLDAAVTSPYLELRSFYVAGGRLWIYNQDWNDLSELPWAVLDATDLRPLVVNGEAIPIEPALPRTREMLGAD